jgi:hypothetical protein
MCCVGGVEGLRLARWEDLKVVGDPMFRPMSDWEWHFLVPVIFHSIALWDV